MKWAASKRQLYLAILALFLITSSALEGNLYYGQAYYSLDTNFAGRLICRNENFLAAYLASTRFSPLQLCH